MSWSAVIAPARYRRYVWRSQSARAMPASLRDVLVAAAAGAVLGAELGGHRRPTPRQLTSRQDPVTVDAPVNDLVQIIAPELDAADLAPAVRDPLRPCAALCGTVWAVAADDGSEGSDGRYSHHSGHEPGHEPRHGRTTVISWPRPSTGPMHSG